MLWSVAWPFPWQLNRRFLGESFNIYVDWCRQWAMKLADASKQRVTNPISSGTPYGISYIYIYIAVPHTDRNSEHWCWVKWMFIPRSQWYLNSFWSIENIGESENGIYTVYPFSIAIQEEQWYVDCISWKIILHYITDKPSCARWSLFAHFKNHENSYIVHHIPPII
jgi:hypothetical protein